MSELSNRENGEATRIHLEVGIIQAVYRPHLNKPQAKHARSTHPRLNPHTVGGKYHTQRARAFRERERGGERERDVLKAQPVESLHAGSHTWRALLVGATSGLTPPHHGTRKPPGRGGVGGCASSQPGTRARLLDPPVRAQGGAARLPSRTARRRVNMPRAATLAAISRVASCSDT